MLLDRKGIKAQAKGIVKTARVSAYTFTLVYLLIVMALMVVDNLFGAETTVDPEIELQLRQMGIVTVEIPHLITVPASIAAFISLVLGFAEVVFGCGYNLYHLGVRRGREMGYNTLTEGFTFAGKAILLAVVMEIFIFLWTMLFIIPGIIAAYRYRMAKLFLLDHPDAGVMDSIRASKEMMKGHKWECFVLDLSFIGWWLLAAIPYVGYAVSVWVTPYINTTYVLYYMALAGKPVTVGPAPSQNPYM